MQRTTNEHIVRAWFFRDLLLEYYRYMPGPPKADPRHVHEEYQICLSLDCPGEYYYRRARHPVPIQSLSIIHPGEPHAARDVEPCADVTTFRLLYAPPDFVQQITRDIAGAPMPLPFFKIPVLLDPDLNRAFLSLHVALIQPRAALEQESRLLAWFAQLITRYAHLLPQPHALPQARPEMLRIRDFLHEHLAENVSLEHLSSIAGLSPFHLCRVFSQTFGRPPHVYQTQLRIMRAKKLLAAGYSASHAGTATGFYDQSHFGRHFKRLVGVTPGRYRTTARTS